MRIIDQSWEWVQKPYNVLQTIELIGRVCYKSEDKITPESAERFVKMLIDHNHESVIEHVSASVRFITNRGVTHELVRHRLASYSQESTRYVKYNGEMQFIRPVWWNDWEPDIQDLWVISCMNDELAYKRMIQTGSSPQQAREILSNSLKTEIIITANLREWKHIFALRCNKAAHPQMRNLMLDCLAGFKQEIPIIFDRI